MLYPHCAFPLWYHKHSRDTTLLVVLILCTTPACFSTFYRCAMVPTLVENSKFFCVLVTNRTEKMLQILGHMLSVQIANAVL